jgi:phosphoribosyl-AMP cyclohydrolase
LREREDEFQQRGVRIFAVSFESATRTSEYQQKQRLPFPVLRDPRRAAYLLFGIERRAVHKIYRPSTIWYYVRSALRGEFPGRTTGDMFQLGGNVLLDCDGSTLWVYRSSQPADRPSVDAILKEIDRRTGV